MIRTTLAVQPASSQLHRRSAPAIEIDDDKYLVRFARNTEELEAVLKLRFEVFNLELGEGLESSFRTGRDRDQFDATCHHLMVVDKRTTNTVGTYRIQTIEMAGGAAGLYSSGEYDLSSLPTDFLHESIELGRACIAREHRNRQVLFLLWRGLAQYLVSERKRFLFGCCSLTSQDPVAGRQVLNYLATHNYLHSTLMVQARPGYQCVALDAEPLPPDEVKLPKLFATYLGIGAKVCSVPALDRRFKTIDFLVVLDVLELDARSRRMFFGL
jgi:putative hemolysin